MNREETVWKFWYLAKRNRAEQISEWLEEQARKGWHLKKVSVGMQRFTFEQAKPDRIAYAIDFEGTLNPGTRNFIKNSKWELVHKYQSTYLWEKVYDVGDQKPQFYNKRDHIPTQIRSLIITKSIFAYVLGSLLFKFYHRLLQGNTFITEEVLISLFLIEGVVLFKIFQLILKRRKQLKNIY